MNTNFLSEILQADQKYWVVAKKNVDHTHIGRGKRDPDSILLIGIPNRIKLGLERDKITLVALEELEGIHLNNIYLNEYYPPFQYNVTLHDAYRGFPLYVSPKEFLKEAIRLDSKDIGEYEKIAKRMELLKEDNEIKNTK